MPHPEGEIKSQWVRGRVGCAHRLLFLVPKLCLVTQLFMKLRLH